MLFREGMKRDFSLEAAVHDCMHKLASYLSIPESEYSQRLPKVYAADKYLYSHRAEGMADSREVYLKALPKKHTLYEESAHCLDRLTGGLKVYIRSHKRVYDDVLREAFAYYCSRLGSPERDGTIMASENFLLSMMVRDGASPFMEGQLNDLRHVRELLGMLAVDKNWCVPKLKSLLSCLNVYRAGELGHMLGYDLGHYAYDIVEKKQMEGRNFARELMLMGRKGISPLEKYAVVASTVYRLAGQ